VDHARLEVRKTAPSRRSQVDDRCHTAAEREAIRRETPIARVLRQHVGAVVDVDMNVHQAGRDEQARHVHHFLGVTGRNRVGDTRDLPGRDRHVHPAVDVAPRIDDVPTLEQQVVLRLCPGRVGEEQRRRNDSKTFHLSVSFCWRIRYSREAVRMKRLPRAIAGVASVISSSEFLPSSRYSGPAWITKVTPSSLSAKIRPLYAHGDEVNAPEAGSIRTFPYISLPVR